MAYPVYSTQFLTGLFPTAPVYYTVPAGYRAVLRDISVYWNGDVSGGVLNVAIASVALVYRFTGPANVAEGQQWTGRMVLDPGQQLEFSPASGNWGFIASGYLLSLP